MRMAVSTLGAMPISSSKRGLDKAVVMPPEITPELRALMAEIGPRWREDVPGHVRCMIDSYSSVLKQAPKDGVEVTRDIAYGSHPRQRFDIFAPTPPVGRRSTVLFVHGGAFVDGQPNRSQEIYANVLHYFGRHGVVGVNIGYRLAPEAVYPEATRDVAAVVRRIREDAGALKIDPDRIFLMGHSAGGAHVASYAYDRRHWPKAGPGIAGLIVVSGRVRADNLPENPNARKVEAYYGTNPALYDDLSPVTHVDPNSVPTLVAWTEFENPLIDLYCAELVYRLTQAKRRSPPVVWLRDHNHTSGIAHFNTAEDTLGRAILSFMGQAVA
jgi:acetyl esterase